MKLHQSITSLHTDQECAEPPFIQTSELTQVQKDIQSTLNRLESLFAGVQMQLAGVTTLDDLLHCVSTLPSITHRSRRHLESCKNIEEFFNELKYFCDFICYDILKDLVNELGDKDTKDKMVAYIHICETFQRVTRLKDLIGILHKEIRQPPCHTRLTITLEDIWLERTLADLKNVRRRLSSPYPWLLISVLSGSLVVKFLVPTDALNLSIL